MSHRRGHWGTFFPTVRAELQRISTFTLQTLILWGTEALLPATLDPSPFFPALLPGDGGGGGGGSRFGVCLGLLLGEDTLGRWGGEKASPSHIQVFAVTAPVHSEPTT